MHLSIFFIFLGVVIGIIALRIFYYSVKGEIATRKTTPFSQHPSSPSHKILCIGDSVTLGVGASTPKKSLAGLISGDFPKADITIWAKPGIVTSKLLEHVKSQPLEDSYYAILLQVGGMDTVKFVSMEKTRAALDELLKILKPHCERIILIFPNSTGTMPLYHPPISNILNWRAKKMYKVFARLANKYSSAIIDIHGHGLLADKKKYYWSDKIHPNDAGYAVLYQAIRPYLIKVSEKISA